VLSGAHMTLFARVLELLHEADIPKLKSLGVATVFTPGASTQAIVDWVHGNLGAAHSVG